MAKRYTDTEKWNDAWFMDLGPDMKLFWLYLTDNCDHAGIWRVNIRLAGFVTGIEGLTKEKALEAFGDRVLDLGEYWFLRKFVEFQYGKLNPENKVHYSVLKVLAKFGLDPAKDLASPLVDPTKDLARGLVGPTKDLTSPLVGAKDKDIYIYNNTLRKESERLYSLYPSSTAKRPRVAKSRKDIEKIAKVLKAGYPLERAIKEVALTTEYPKDLKTFLNNLPDLEASASKGGRMTGGPM